MKKILIADDEPHVSMILKQFLERTGFQVTTVLNGQQALTQMRRELPDILITDVQMPIMNGMALCDAISQDLPEFQSLIIVMTSRTDNSIRVWAANYPNLELIEKPVSIRHLISRLNDHFANNSR